jgi:hypothetical protein
MEHSLLAACWLAVIDAIGGGCAAADERTPR